MPAVWKNSIAAWSSNDGELATSTTTSAPASAPAKPSPVTVLTPVFGAAAIASCPFRFSFSTTFDPMRPVPPITTIFMTSPLMTVFETTATLPYRFRLGPASPSPSLGRPACGVGNSALCRLTDILSCGRLGPARPCDESAHPRIAFKVDRNHRNALQQKPGADVRFGSTPEKLDLSIRCPLHPPRPTNRRKPWSGFALRKPPTPSIQIGKVPRRGMAMIRATVVRALVLTAALAAALTPVTCLGEDSKQSPTPATKQSPTPPIKPLPPQATKELPPELLALLRQKKMPKNSPILVRIFKEEAELEVWKQDTTGHFQMLKTFPICRWSGDLGPKLHEGDRQAPEGFYTITPE